MKILFLGYDSTKTSLIEFLKSKGHQVKQRSDKISTDSVVGFDWVISFGYRHIISKEVIESSNDRIINLHISYLPYNRGSHPLFWAFHDKTPIGVTIHKVDEGLDTGDIYVQRLVEINPLTETFLSGYNKLILEIEQLFIKTCDYIFSSQIPPRKQIGKGSYHKSSDLPFIKSWDTNISRFFDMSKRTDSEIIDEIEKIRARNNVNWMDAVRLAFELSPDRARSIFKDIKECDARINELLNELADNDEKN
jgi:folate-dependent phosphoribosylglycinamide formyltransferase PurN